METKDVLKKLRKEHKFVQSDVADFLGIDRSTYSNYELGKTTPSYENLIQLKRIYNVSIDYLIDNDNYQRTISSKKGFSVSVSDSNPVSQLSKEEITILACYRLLSEEDKASAVEMMKKFTKEKTLTEKKGTEADN